MNRTWTGLAVRKLSKQRNHVDQDLKMFPRVGSTAVLGWLRRRAHMVCIPNFCRETDSISIPRSFSQVWAPGCQFRLPAQRTRALTRPKSEWKPSSWVHQLLPATSFYHFFISYELLPSSASIFARVTRSSFARSLPHVSRAATWKPLDRQHGKTVRLQRLPGLLQIFMQAVLRAHIWLRLLLGPYRGVLSPESKCFVLWQLCPSTSLGMFFEIILPDLQIGAKRAKGGKNVAKM